MIVIDKVKWWAFWFILFLAITTHLSVIGSELAFISFVLVIYCGIKLESAVREK